MGMEGQACLSPIPHALPISYNIFILNIGLIYFKLLSP